ncbi:MAG: hypothetical protein JWP59_3216 [Massilia sp.]|nr:hypothetical protein [Massilia sp.]
MDPLKHMEVIFGAVAAIALLLAAVPDSDARAAARPNSVVSAPTHSAQSGSGTALAIAEEVRIATPGTMAIVVIKGKRLSAREKRRAALAASAIAAPERS